jgi:hypothetical protein
MSETEENDQPESGGETGPMPQGLTRREWILRLGEAAVLAGFSGAASEALTAPPAAIDSKKLPPGLYDPSGERMAHVLQREGRFVTPPAGSETEYAAPYAARFAPAFFSEEDFNVARRLVGLMLNSGADTAIGLPAVDNGTVDEIAQWIDLALSQAAATRDAAKSLTVQHRELALHFYGEEAVRRLETTDPEKTWRDGLAWFEQESRKLSGQGFLSLAEAQQLELLDSIGDSHRTMGNRDDSRRAETPGTELYRLLKGEIIQGYYTSRSGLKELDYQGNAFHAESPGCANR